MPAPTDDDLLRSWQAGDPSAGATWLVARLEAGALGHEALEAAALSGELAARLALCDRPRTVLPVPYWDWVAAGCPTESRYDMARKRMTQCTCPELACDWLEAHLPAPGLWGHLSANVVHGTVMRWLGELCPEVTLPGWLASARAVLEAGRGDRRALAALGVAEACLACPCAVHAAAVLDALGELRPVLGSAPASGSDLVRVAACALTALVEGGAFANTPCVSTVLCRELARGRDYRSPEVQREALGVLRRALRTALVPVLLGTGDALAARHPPLAGVERFGIVPPRRDGRGCSVVDRSLPRAPGDFAGDTQRWRELHAGGVTYVAEGGGLRAALSTLRFRVLAGRPEPLSTYANEAWHPAPYPAGEPAEQLRILEEALAACAG